MAVEADFGALDGLHTFPRLLLNHARTRPDAPAMREKYLGIWQTWSWADVAERVRALACGLAELGFKIAAYPLSLLGASVRAMRDALEQLHEGRPAERRVSFPELREIVGFDWYDAEAGRYALHDAD